MILDRTGTRPAEVVLNMVEASVTDFGDAQELAVDVLALDPGRLIPLELSPGWNRKGWDESGRFECVIHRDRRTE